MLTTGTLTVDNYKQIAFSPLLASLDVYKRQLVHHNTAALMTGREPH